MITRALHVHYWILIRKFSKGRAAEKRLARRRSSSWTPGGDDACLPDALHVFWILIRKVCKGRAAGERFLGEDCGAGGLALMHACLSKFLDFEWEG